MKFHLKLLYVLLVFSLLGCQNREKSKELIELTENGKTLEFYLPAEEGELAPQKNEELEGSSKPPKHINERLPLTYTSRKFINAAAIGYDIYYLPGNIVKYNAADTTYRVVTLKALIEKNGKPITELVQDGLLYSNRINRQASFNASFMIGGVSADDQSMVELLIQDINKSIVPDSLVDINAINAIKAKIPDAEKLNYFFVRSALLTFVNHKKFRSTSFSAKGARVFPPK
jgi:hypothetical protein